MKFKKTILTATLLTGLAAITALFLGGCQKHDHAGDDHAGHDHGKTGETAKTPAAPSQPVIEKPTAEQLAAAKPYPLETCLVSGEKLGSMGEPPVMIVNGQQIKLCCKSCLKDFKRESAKYLEKIGEANRKERK